MASGKRAQRLRRLVDAWETRRAMRLTVADLRLLLEWEDGPLRRLAEGADGCEALRARVAELEAECERLRREGEEAVRERERLEAERLRCREALAEAREACEAALGRVAALEAGPAWGSAEAARRLLQAAPAVAQRLGLEALSADTEGLIRAVAVLSQRDKIERLHDALREAVEAGDVGGDAAGDLMRLALDWHNHNWRQRPLTLLAPRPGDPFDFDRHRRAARTPSGERIAATCVPGVSEGNGRVWLKAVVETRP